MLVWHKHSRLAATSDATVSRSPVCASPGEGIRVGTLLSTWVSTQDQLVRLVWFSFLSHKWLFHLIQTGVDWLLRTLISQCLWQWRGEAFYFEKLHFRGSGENFLGHYSWIKQPFFGPSSFLPAVSRWDRLFCFTHVGLGNLYPLALSFALLSLSFLSFSSLIFPFSFIGLKVFQRAW